MPTVTLAVLRLVWLQFTFKKLRSKISDFVCHLSVRARKIGDFAVRVGNYTFLNTKKHYFLALLCALNGEYSSRS